MKKKIITLLFAIVASTGICFASNTSVGGIWYNFNNANYTADRTFTIADPDTYKGTDGTPVGVTGGTYPWYKQPEIPYVKDLNATVSDTNLNVTYEAGVRTTNPPTE